MNPDTIFLSIGAYLGIGFCYVAWTLEAAVDQWNKRNKRSCPNEVVLFVSILVALTWPCFIAFDIYCRRK